MKTNLAVSVCFSFLCVGLALGQEKAADPKPDAKPQPAVAPAPAPAAPEPAAAVPAAPPAAGGFENAEAVDRWMEGYYKHPEPERVLEAFRTLAREKVIGLTTREGADKNWDYAAFFWACMKENAASMAEWCATIGPLEEPAKTWWWTPVWMSQTVAGNEAINAAINLPLGHKNRIAFKWLAQKPVDILQTPFRREGKQQLSMLWSAFCATGDKAMIYKMYEAFVPSEPKPANNPQQAQLVQAQIQHNKKMVENVRRSFAENLPRHPKALEICKESIANLREPVKSEIARLVAEAEAKVSGGDAKPATEEPKPAAEAKPDTKPAPEPETTLTPKADPKPQPKEEPKSEPKLEPKTEPKSDPK